MKDDYLWDGRGEAEPEVEELEMLLGKLRYQPRPLEMPAPPRRIYWPQLAVAAMIIMALAAGLMFYLRRESGIENQNTIADQKAETVAPQDSKQDAQPLTPQGVEKPETGTDKNLTANSVMKPKRPTTVREESLTTGKEFLAVNTAHPIIIPFLDPETSKHIERSQFLLRDFRNAGESDVTYERERSKRLLVDNILLRRSAESAGNMPVESLLGSLEPILLDIANLPEKPSADDVRAIKERIQKKEIVATLQVYSAQAVSIVQ